MKNMKVMNHRVDTNELGGMACGPFGMDVACAEMHIKDETGEKYLTLCWVSEAAESLEFDITTLPIFEYLLSDDLDEDEMSRFLSGNYKECPYYQLDDEYLIVRHQM